MISVYYYLSNFNTMCHTMCYKRHQPIQNLDGLMIIKNPGNDLLSHAPTHAVPSAQQVLTTLFGMGRGVTPAIESPRL